MRGSVNSKEALNNNVARENIHNEIFFIEKAIRDMSSNNYRELTVNFTFVTNNSLSSFNPIDSVDVSSNTLVINSHDFVDDDIIVLKNDSGTLPSPLIGTKFYGIKVVDANSIELYDIEDINETIIEISDSGDTGTSTRKANASELFLKAWEDFYIFNFSESYIYIMEKVEEHFRSQGFYIVRLKDDVTKTVKWKIRW